MKKLCLLALFAISIQSSFAQKTEPSKDWVFEAGPYVGVTTGAFHISHSFGIGVDGKLTKMVSSHFSVGGEVSYAYFFGKTVIVKAPGTSLVGIYGNVQYTQDRAFIGGDLGLGIGFQSGSSTAAFARTAYAGYQVTTGDKPISLAIYFNRTIIASYNLGIRCWFRF